MHGSYFRVLDTVESNVKNDLALDPGVSEWLFFVDFWNQINENLQSDFNQYEDDIIYPEWVDTIINYLNKTKETYLNDEARQHTFVYAWSPDGKTFECSITNIDITNNIDYLIEFLHSTKDTRAQVLAQL